MNEIIVWCNNNQGFIDAVLSLTTIFMSVVAICISIHTARLPYKKKIIVRCGIATSYFERGYHVDAINVGNRNVKISTIGFYVGKKVAINMLTIKDSIIILPPSEVTTQIFTIGQMKEWLARFLNEPQKKVYGYVRDSEGKEYKRLLGKVKYLIQ